MADPASRNAGLEGGSFDGVGGAEDSSVSLLAVEVTGSAGRADSPGRSVDET
jgi:hypothetical protein